MPSPLLVLAVTAVGLLGGGLALTLRARRRHGVALGLLLMMAATTAGYVVVRQWPTPALPAAEPLPPLRSGSGQFQTLPAAELDQALAAARGQVVLIDFYADWCSSCQVWERQVFSRPEAQRALAPLVLIRIDATEFTPAVEALFQRYGLPGLPALVVIDRTGRERPELRFTGESALAEFVDRVHGQLWPLLPK